MKNLIIILSFLGLMLGSGVSSFSQVMDSPPRDGVFDKIHTIERKAIPYAHLREADVMWSRRIWRVIDLREKINQPFYYPEFPHNGWKNLVTIIMDAMKEGSITAYDPNTPTDEFLVPLTYEEIMTKLDRYDSTSMQRFYPPYDWYDTVIHIEFNVMDVKRIRIKEDWFVDKQRSQMDVRILGLCPVRESYDEEGIFRGYEPLFWIYFPEARPIFAKNEVFNRFNDAERRTYDDVFWKRMFGSYVYKEQNVYDRKIVDYAMGLDALLEAERVKNDLFKFEHDLWEY
ncbi:MAG: gliding motility protein GldN [Bacteroidales bacterium]|nr:gliding motility protein GldN [Bacteroidales bacterium]